MERNNSNAWPWSRSNFSQSHSFFAVRVIGRRKMQTCNRYYEHWAFDWLGAKHAGDGRAPWSVGLTYWDNMSPPTSSTRLLTPQQQRLTRVRQFPFPASVSLALTSWTALMGRNQKPGPLEGAAWEDFNGWTSSRTLRRLGATGPSDELCYAQKRTSRASL